MAFNLDFLNKLKKQRIHDGQEAMAGHGMLSPALAGGKPDHAAAPAGE